MKQFLFFLAMFCLPTMLWAQHTAFCTDDTHFCSHVKTRGTLNEVPYAQSPLVHFYDVKFYKLDVELYTTSAFIKGNVTVAAEVIVEVLDTFALELLNNMQVDSVFVNGAINEFEHTNDHIIIPLENEYTNGEMIEVVVYYQGTPVNSGFFSGLSSAAAGGSRVTWSLSSPYNARQWWPVKQILADKADSTHIFVTTSSPFKVGANGMLHNVIDLGEGKVRYEWKHYYPINFYLISVAVGPYAEYSFYAPIHNETDSVLIQNFVYANQLENLKPELHLTAPLINLFSDIFGTYPFKDEKYGHTMAPIGGAMEHQTMTTMGGFSFLLTGHELAHQWFGNNVTCATWSDIWINEGFATYSEYLATQFLQNETAARNWLLSKQGNAMGSSGGSIYVPANEIQDVWRIFSGRLTYNKGASIIHMLRFELNDDDLFFNVLQTFQNQYANSVATGDDFKQVAENLSGRDFDWFFDQWYYGQGFPRFNFVFWQSNDTLYVRSVQTTSSPATPFFRTSLEIKAVNALTGQDTLMRVEQLQNEQVFELLPGFEVTTIQADPNLWVLKRILSTTNLFDPKDLGDSVTLFPNPSSDEIKIYIPWFEAWKTYDVEIFDMQGRRLMALSLSGSNQPIKVAHLPAGCYIVKGSSKDEGWVFNKKLFKR